MQLADSPEEVLVHRVEVINIVLHPEAHGHEFRDKNIQEPRFQHNLEHRKGFLRIEQNIKELPDYLGVLPSRLGESPKILANNAAGLMMEVGIRLGRLPEKLHEQPRVFPDPFGLQEMEMAAIEQKGAGEDASPNTDSGELSLSLPQAFEKK